MTLTSCHFPNSEWPRSNSDDWLCSAMKDTATPWREPATVSVGWHTSCADGGHRQNFTAVEEKAEISSLAQQSWQFASACLIDNILTLCQMNLFSYSWGDRSYSFDCWQ